MMPKLFTTHGGVTPTHPWLARQLSPWHLVPITVVFVACGGEDTRLTTTVPDPDAPRP